MALRRTMLVLLSASALCLLLGYSVGHFVHVDWTSKFFKPEPSINSTNHPIVASFLRANPVLPEWNMNSHPPVKSWNYLHPLGNSNSIRITATGWIGGHFLGQYSDEPKPRVIGDPGDYVYPCALRFDPKTNRVYAKADGLAGGLYRETIIFEFDITTRNSVGHVRVNPNILPPDPGPKNPLPNSSP